MIIVSTHILALCVMDSLKITLLTLIFICPKPSYKVESIFPFFRCNITTNFRIVKIYNGFTVNVTWIIGYWRFSGILCFQYNASILGSFYCLLSKPQPNLNWPDFDETLQVGSWEHLEQIPTFRVTFVHATFVHATFVLVTYVHIRNISAVTDPILMKLYR